MARPETIADLPDYDEPITVAEIHDAKLMDLNSEELTAVGEAIRTLSETFGEERKYGSIRYCRMLSRAELQDRLRKAQAKWDYHERSYNAALLDNKLPYYNFERRSIDKWANEEGLEPIDWDALNAAKAEEEAA